MKKTKTHLLRTLSIFLCLILALSTVLVAGVFSASAGAEEGIYLRGNMNGWNCYDEHKFVDNGNGIYTLVLDMKGGTYNFKIATPTWSVTLEDKSHPEGHIVYEVESDSIVKFTANVNNRTYNIETMNTKSDFTLGDKALTIEAEKYTYALGSVSVLSDSKASAGKYVGDFGEGDSLNYGTTVSGNTAKTYRFSVNVASAEGDGMFNFKTGDQVTEATFLGTNGWQNYKTLVFTKTLNPGYNRITIDNTFGTFNVDKIYVEPVTNYADVIGKDAVVDFDGYDYTSDTAIISGTAIKNASAGDVVSVIVDPELDGVYQVSVDADVTAKQLLLGDADQDEKVTVKDATVIQKHAAELVTLAGDAALCADVDNSGKINVKDATAIQKHVAEIEVDYPIGEMFTTAAAYSRGLNDQIGIGTELGNLTAISEDNPYATLVIDGETEVFVGAFEDGVTVNNIKFTYIPNVELMGYEFYTEESMGYRFATDFSVDSVVVGGYFDIPASTLVFSDGAKAEVPALKEGETYTVKHDADSKITWIKLEGEESYYAYMEILGVKDVQDTTVDIALDGYVSTSAGWQPTSWFAYDELTAEKFGLGFDKEVTVNKVTFTSATEAVPQTVKVTTASGKTMTLTGTSTKNDSCYETAFAIDGGLYSFGFYFEFDELVTINMISAEGDTTFKGASTNVSDAWDYEMFVNGLTENDSRVIANDGYTIITSETGSDRTWTLSEDISESPTFYAPNTPLAEAAYNLTMEEIYKSINTDETYGDVFYTGTNWHKVWTRDTAISMQYVLSWLFPEISTNCANAKVVGTNGNLTFEEDTGTGGSYPVSTDRIIMMLAVWETYLADGNEETLEYFYEVASNTIKQDYTVVYDEEAGLFRGETCGLDHRDKTYPDWTSENISNGIVAIAEGKAASTNIIYCQVMKILSESATILGKDAKEAQAWADLAAALEEAISTRLWHEDLGTYASWEYPDWMGSPLPYKQDVLANGYAVWYNIGGQEKADSIMENHTLVNFGANTVYPNKNAFRWTDYKYHDSGVWPGWEALLMIGAVNNENENNLLAEEIWNSCVRGAAACLTNYEVIDYETGEGLHSTQQLWSVAATMAGYYRVLYGMEYTTEGITFDPYVPEWMEGPFTIENYKYRDADLTMNLYGDGDTVAEMYVNGEKVAADYVFPTDAKGEYTIDIILEDSGAVDKINLTMDNAKKAPTAPTVTRTGSTLKWNAVDNCTYKVWTGSEYVDVNDTTYTFDNTKYGCYCVVAVDKTTGIWSELSSPITYSPAGSTIKVTANKTDKLQSTQPYTFKVTVPVDGVYQFHSIHSNTNVGDPTSSLTAAIRSVYVDGKDVGTLVFPTSNKANQNSSHLRLELTAGEHEITVKYDKANWYDTNMSESRDGYAHNDVHYNSFVFTLVEGDFSGFGGEDNTDIDPYDIDVSNGKYPIVDGYNTVVYSSKGWTKAYVYAWNDGGNTGDWPGTEMKFALTNDYGENQFVAYIPVEYSNYIINNGSGTQTIDLNVTKSIGMYMASQNGDGKWTIGEWNPDFYDYN